MDKSPSVRKAYRFYTLETNGHIIDGRWLEFDSREAALEHAQAMAVGRVIEVWDGVERLGVFTPTKAARC